MHVSSPKPIQSRVYIEPARHSPESLAIENPRKVFLKKGLVEFEERIFWPMMLHGPYPNIYFTIVLPVLLAMDVHMQEGLTVILLCPGM